MISISATATIRGSIHLPASKSLANRLLILQALRKEPLDVSETEEADDIQVLRNALSLCKEIKKGELQIGHAGTAMRFLTAYLAQSDGEWILSGSDRMHERPIAVLVNALRELGADIHYLQQEGFPPLQIYGKSLRGGTLLLPASFSSQYISALLLIAPFLKGGLQLQLSGTPVSKPYIDMTLAILERAGASVLWQDELLRVKEGFMEDAARMTSIEADWTAASYYFAICALSPGSEIRLKGLDPNSLQGDAVLPQLFAPLGVAAEWEQADLVLKHRVSGIKQFNGNFVDCPDLAQTCMTTCLGLGISGRFEGLQTLKIKETDRIQAMHNELQKFGLSCRTGADFLEFDAPQSGSLEKPVIHTYSDHRMAMAFAPLGLKYPGLCIKNEEVVSKSYPAFWEHLISLGFNVNLQPE